MSWRPSPDAGPFGPSSEAQQRAYEVRDRLWGRWICTSEADPAARQAVREEIIAAITAQYVGGVIDQKRYADWLHLVGAS